jgi:hypothetical protein
VVWVGYKERRANLEAQNRIYVIVIFKKYFMFKFFIGDNTDRLCGLVVRVLGYISGGPGSIPGTTKKK